jgi:hypothetical protein
MKALDSERLDEMLRMFAVAVSGAIFMVVQRWLFENFLIPRFRYIGNPLVFLNYAYNPAIISVFAASVLSIILWYLTSLKLRDDWKPKDLKLATSIWFVFLLIPITIMAIFLWIIGNKSQILLPFSAISLVFDIIWLFWQGTSVVTPSTVSVAIPLSHLWRGLWRIK